MIVLALDVAVIAIIVFCGWRGYKNGLIRGVFGIVSLVVSLFLASVASTAYSTEFKEMLSPFVGGFVDSALVEIIEEDTEYDQSDFEDKSDNYITAYTALRKIGLSEAACDRVALMTTEDNEEQGTHPALLSDLITDKLSSALSFAAVFGIAFLLLAIIFSVIGNLVGFVFSLPGLRLLDIIAGAAFGVVKGLIIVLALAAVVRYVGLLAPDTLDKTTVLKYLVNNNLIANRLGI